MITCKEDLINTYVKNTPELRREFLSLAVKFGLIDSSTVCGSSEDAVVAYWHDVNGDNPVVGCWYAYADQIKEECRELTLSDLKPEENMKTYKTYQECKIENPECEVYLSMNGDFADENHVGYVSMCGTGAGWNKCNPADHCMTVKEFLGAGYRFVEGDLIFSTACSDRVVLVTNERADRATYSVSVANADSPSDNERYVLHSASLEWLKRADDADREVLSRVGAQLSTVRLNKKSNPFLTDSIPKLKRTKVEYVKVTDSIWHLESDFKAGDLFSFDGESDYVQVETEGDFTLSHSADNLFRRIETPMAEREAFIEVATSILSNENGNVTIGEHEAIRSLFDSGKFKLVN